MWLQRLQRLHEKTEEPRRRRWRFYAESLIEQAINILDALDGDADLEDGRDGEPSLAPYR